MTRWEFPPRFCASSKLCQAWALVFFGDAIIANGGSYKSSTGKRCYCNNGIFENCVLEWPNNNKCQIPGMGESCSDCVGIDYDCKWATYYQNDGTTLEYCVHNEDLAFMIGAYRESRECAAYVSPVGCQEWCQQECALTDDKCCMGLESCSSCGFCEELECSATADFSQVDLSGIQAYGVGADYVNSHFVFSWVDGQYRKMVRTTTDGETVQVGYVNRYSYDWEDFSTWTSNPGYYEISTFVGGCASTDPFVAISVDAACEDNYESVERYFGDYGFTLESCKEKCLLDSRCNAIDFYTSGWCNTYEEPCNNPLTTRDGSSSYRLREERDPCAMVACGWPTCDGDATPITKEGECCPSCPIITYELGSRGSYACDNGGSTITNPNDCSTALWTLSIPEYTLNNGICYVDARGNGYSDGQNGNGARFVCKIVN